MRGGTDQRTEVAGILHINATLLYWGQVKTLEALDQHSQDLYIVQFTMLRKYEPDTTIGKFFLLLEKNLFPS